MSNAAILYKGEDSVFTLDLGTDVFADLQDVYVGLVINNTLVKTWKKSESTQELKVLPVSGKPNHCKVCVFRSESNTWTVGLMQLEPTLIYTDGDFPDGKHDMEVLPIGKLVASKTGDI